MTKLIDDADYDADETFENVPSPLSDAGNHDNYFSRRLRTRCVLLSRPDNKTKLRRAIQMTNLSSGEALSSADTTRLGQPPISSSIDYQLISLALAGFASSLSASPATHASNLPTQSSSTLSEISPPSTSQVTVGPVSHTSSTLYDLPATGTVMSELCPAANAPGFTSTASSQRAKINTPAPNRSGSPVRHGTDEVWRTTCLDLINSLPDDARHAYIRMMFQFLSCSPLATGPGSAVHAIMYSED
ncbi:unnamed protein product [Protopolystoma xenopodis]|uniref:Uncharacterized protein n=1 Tax=Protopolystoma xenopodis TaxID=117903 RepID=A0A3S5BNB9_9PLAT|nr:unnamed protein product [Protopolystoma xenopodis]